MKKRVIALLLATSMCITAFGCGKKEDKKEEDKEVVMEVKEDDDIVADKKVPKDNVTLGKYKGIEVTVSKIEVSDEDLQTRLESAFSSKITYTDITDRAVADGDIVNLDYRGSVDGEEFEGGSAEGFDLTIGSGQFIDGFEAQLVGKNIGENSDITVTFPDEYPNNPDLAGKEAVFNVTINSIKTENELVINDELVNEVSPGKTLEKYKEELKATMMEEKETSAESEKQSNAWSKVVEDCEVQKLPLTTVQESADLFYTSYEQYKEAYGMSDEEYEKEILSMAKDNVRNRLIAIAIAEKEGIKISEDEYQEQLEELAVNTEDGKTETVEKTYGQEYIKDVMLLTKVMEFVSENAKEVQAQTEEETTGVE